MITSSITRLLLTQGHLIWALTIVNIYLGFFIVGFDPIRDPISAVALEAPAFAYTHRALDITIGVSMCLFALGFQLLRRTFAFSAVAVSLVGISMISAGIWTLESPLHELYGLSIFLIIIPVVTALEFRELLSATKFEIYSIGMTFLHVAMFWLIYAGFIPEEYKGVIQRAWAAATMAWFGIAVHVVLRSVGSDNIATQAACDDTRA